MTAKQLKSKAPVYWKSVEDAVYDDCRSVLREARRAVVKRNGVTFYCELTDEWCKRFAHKAAFIATSEFVSRAGK